MLTSSTPKTDEKLFISVCFVCCFSSKKKNGEKCTIDERKIKSFVCAFNIFFFFHDDKKTKKTKKK